MLDSPSFPSALLFNAVKMIGDRTSKDMSQERVLDIVGNVTRPGKIAISQAVPGQGYAQDASDRFVVEGLLAGHGTLPKKSRHRVKHAGAQKAYIIAIVVIMSVCTLALPIVAFCVHRRTRRAFLAELKAKSETMATSDVATVRETSSRNRPCDEESGLATVSEAGDLGLVQGLSSQATREESPSQLDDTRENQGASTAKSVSTAEDPGLMNGISSS